MATVTASYSATVTSSGNPSIAVGDTLTGNLVYGTTQTGSGGNYTFTGSSVAHDVQKFTVYTSGGTEVLSDEYWEEPTSEFQVTIAYNTTFGGVTGTLFTLVFQTTGGLLPTFYFFDPSNTGVTSDALPTQAEFANFTGHVTAAF